MDLDVLVYAVQRVFYLVSYSLLNMSLSYAFVVHC